MEKAKQDFYCNLVHLGLEGALPYRAKEVSFLERLKDNSIEMLKSDSIEELGPKEINAFVLKTVQSSGNTGSMYIFTGDMGSINWIIGLNGGINFNVSSFAGIVNVSDIPSVDGTYFLSFPDTFHDGFLNTSDKIGEIKTIPIGYIV